MGKTLYDLVDGWTKQPWDGESYMQIASELFSYLNGEGKGLKPIGIAVGRLYRRISGIQDAFGIVYENDDEAIDALRRFMEENEEFKEYAPKMNIDIQETPKFTATVTNLEALV